MTTVARITGTIYIEVGGEQVSLGPVSLPVSVRNVLDETTCRLVLGLVTDLDEVGNAVRAIFREAETKQADHDRVDAIRDEAAQR